MHLMVVLLAGALFGGGIAISGMGDPAKVQNFLDLAGQWDPSLAFVMGGGLLITTPGFWFLFKGSKPWFADAFALPTLKEVDGKLLTGAVLFGIGWGVSGLCPAPALVALLTGQAAFFIFAAALVAGMLLHYLILERRRA